jgi:hypothetical protein
LYLEVFVMGATASTVKSYNEIVSSHKRGQTFIPIHGIHEHLRMFQHQKDGDILILIDTDAEAFLKDPTSSEYHEIFISRRGTNYLENVAGAMTFQANKALSNVSSTYERNGNTPSQLPSGQSAAAADGSATEKEPTLYQLHLREHTNKFFDTLGAADQPGKGESKQPLQSEEEHALEPAEEKEDKEHDARSPVVRDVTTSGVSSSLDHESESMRQNSGFIATPVANRSIDIEGDFVVNSTFSSLSRSVDARESSSVPTSAAAAIFLRHEQEALARARGESLRSIAEESSDAKTVPSAASVPRFSPRRNSADAKDFPVRETTPRVSPRAPAAPGSAHSVATGSPVINSTTATAGASPLLSSRAESKESKETAPTPSTPAVVRKRDIVPVAYLPPGEHLRQRILEEDSGAKPPTSARDPDAKTDLGGAPMYTPRGSVLCAAADSKSPPLRSPRGVLRAEALISPRSSALATPGGVVGGGADGQAASEQRRRAGSECCPVCFLPLRCTGDSVRYEAHITSCRMREEMRNALVDIDQNLEPVRTPPHLTMNCVLQCPALHAAVPCSTELN